MPGVACTSVPPVSLCLAIRALTIPLAAAAAQEETAASHAAQDGALGILVIKARIHGRCDIRRQTSKGIPADIKNRGHIGTILYFLCSWIHFQTHMKIREYIDEIVHSLNEKENNSAR